ncbi:MAG: hypothetical protein WCK20_03925 [Thermoleophilia bacterium]
MAPAPIVIKCECGVETRGRSGETIRCQGCGLKYNTEDDAHLFNVLAASAQRKFKVLSRMGVGFVGLIALVGFFTLSYPGMIGGALAAGGLWFGLLMPYMKKRVLASTTARYTPTITASRK